MTGDSIRHRDEDGAPPPAGDAEGELSLSNYVPDAAGGSDRPPGVAVVTVNYNGRPYIGDFLLSLRGVRYPSMQLYVVDCGSRDGSPEVVERLMPEATVIRLGDNLGFTGGNNAGVEQALRDGYPYVLFLNNDTVLDPNLIAALMARAAPRTLVVPRVELFGAGGLLDDTAGDFDWRRGVWKSSLYGRPAPPDFQEEREVEMASLCCLLAPASVFRHAGLLDERLFMYYEDFDWVRRARSAGYRIRYVPEAVVFHRKSASSGGGDSPFKLYYATRNRVALLRRYGDRAGFAVFSLDFALTRIVRAAQYLLTGRSSLAGAMLRGWTDAYRGRMGRRFPPPRTQPPNPLPREGRGSRLPPP